MIIKKSIMLLNNIKLMYSHIHKFRGFVGNRFKNYDIIHNHDDNKDCLIYRYPLIQFKLIDKTPAIVAITKKASNAFLEIFMKLDNIIIDDKIIPILKTECKTEEEYFGYSDEQFTYEFISPWIGLNKDNFMKYTNETDKDNILRKIIIGNILSTSKYLGCNILEDQIIKVDVKLKEIKVNLKGKTMLGFNGIFKTNFLIPDYLGIGKSVSRGFGTVRRVK